MDCATSQNIRCKLVPDPTAYEQAVRLSIAAPAFNEGAVIRDVVEGWLDHLTHLPEVTEFEIVICNDGSRDATGAILDALARKHREVHPIHFAANQGGAAALTAAIAATRFEWVLLTDSDGQFPIENVAAMLSEVGCRCVPAVIGIRSKKDRPFARFGTVSSGFVCNLVHRSSLRDFNSAFKLIWGPLLRALDLEAKGMNYSTEITSRLLEWGVPIAEVAIDHRPRASGLSHMKMMRGAIERLMFVAYIAVRQALLGAGVLRRRLSWQVIP
jgi:glycosyltransferase involved in cell wall biosynthesis